jgi:transcriptional regulator with XRE-family HTH domain
MPASDPRDIDKQLEHVLAEVRKSLRLTQVEVAARLGKPQSFVSKYETGELKLTVGNFIIVCDAIKTEPDIILKQLTLRG